MLTMIITITTMALSFNQRYNFNCHLYWTTSGGLMFVEAIYPFLLEEKIESKIPFKWFGLLLSNSLRPRQNRHHFADDVFKCNFLNENVWIPIKILLKFVPQCPINNIPALVQIMAWRRSGDKPLSEPMMIGLLAHICVTRPQGVKYCPKKRVQFSDEYVS